MPGNVPKLIHLVWVGGPMPDKYVDNIAKWKKLNADYSVALWYDSRFQRVVADRPSQGAQLAFLRGCNVLTHDVKDFEQRFSVQAMQYYVYECAKLVRDQNLNQLAKPNFGAASDILRVELLVEYQGIYFDTDIGAGVLGGVQTPNDEGLLVNYYCDESGYLKNVTNDIMAASKPDFFQKLRALIASNYDEYLEQGSERMRAASKDENVLFTVNVSGPNALAAAMGKSGIVIGQGERLAAQLKLRNYLFPRERVKVSDQSDNTWL